MSCDFSEERYVRTDTVLGGALQWSPGPEATAMERTWKETLGWDDGLSLSTPRWKSIWVNFVNLVPHRTRAGVLGRCRLNCR